MPFDIAFSCVAGTSILAFVPHGIRVQYYLKLTGGKYNNVESRQQFSSSPLMNDPNAAIVKRASNCHQNALENFPFFVAGVLMAKVAGVSAHRVDRYALVHLVARLLYIPLYVYVSRQKYSYLRTLVFTIGHLASLGLMVEAALAK